MKRLVLASLGALAVVTMMGAANAADLPRRHAMPTKAPMYEAPYNWTGFYVGINGGGGWGHSNWDAYGTGLNPTAASSAAPSVTTIRRVRPCSASKATSTGAICAAPPPAASAPALLRNAQ